MFCPGPEVCLIPLAAGRAQTSFCPPPSSSGTTLDYHLPAGSPLILPYVAFSVCLWPGSTEREVIDEAPKWQRVVMRDMANFPLWILKEGEALEIPT